MKTADPRPALGRRQDVTLDWHWRDPSSVEITMLHVPSALGRRAGHGRRAYEAWEQALPATVTMIYVWVADTDGEGRPFGFWEAMGFSYRYADDEDDALSYEAAGWMIKRRD